MTIINWLLDIEADVTGRSFGHLYFILSLHKIIRNPNLQELIILLEKAGGSEYSVEGQGSRVFAGCCWKKNKE